MLGMAANLMENGIIQKSPKLFSSKLRIENKSKNLIFLNNNLSSKQSNSLWNNDLSTFYSLEFPFWITDIKVKNRKLESFVHFGQSITFLKEHLECFDKVLSKILISFDVLIFNLNILSDHRDI